MKVGVTEWHCLVVTISVCLFVVVVVAVVVVWNIWPHALAKDQ